MDLSVLTTRELDTLGKRIHKDGKFGADYAPMKKAEKIAFIKVEAAKEEHDPEMRELWLEELAKGIIAARDENPEEDVDENPPTDCEAQSAQHEDDKKGEQKQETKGGEFPGGFGFEAGEPNCPDGAKCPYHDGGTCSHFEEQENCSNCGVEYGNADHHFTGEDGERCKVEEKLDEFHNSSGTPQAKPDLSMDLISLIKAVTHEEHDSTFIEVGKALGRAEHIVRTVIGALEKVDEKATEALESVKESRKRKLITAPNLTITFPNIPAVSLEGKHPIIFPKVMALMSLPDGIRQPVLLYGDAGGGKTTISEQVADAFGLFPDYYGAMSCTGDMTSGKLNGRILPIGNGQYIPSDLMRLMEGGKRFLYCVDEFDVSPGEIKIGLNTLLAQNAIYVEERSFAGLPVRVVVPSGSMFIACQNTINGPDAIYTSRQIPDGAANDRWIILKMDSDPRVGASIMGAPYTPLDNWIPQERSDEELRAELLVSYKKIRQIQVEVKKKKIRRLVTDRAFLRARALLTAGFTQEETMDVLLEGWKEDEKAQVGVGATI